MSIVSSSPHTPLSADLLLIRQEMMSGNGINIIYPLGRDYGLTYPGRFPAYHGFAASVFGYVIDARTLCEFGLTGKYSGFVAMKFGSDKKAVVVAKADNSSSYTYASGSYKYEYGYQFLFRFRAGYYANIDKNAVKGIEHSDNLYTRPMDISEFKFTETFSQNGNHVFLSVHFGDYPPAEFPTHTGLDPIIAGVVIMEVGSYAVYEGIYSGSDAIGINAPGAVRDLGKPQTSGVTVRIGIRKGLTMYVFLADYGTDPVSAPFSELLMHGHYYIPRFTANFNVRRVQIETYY